MGLGGRLDATTVHPYRPLIAILGIGYGDGYSRKLSNISYTYYKKQKFKIKDAKVLYGGSVNPKNASILKQISSINGFLIGGASQNANKFIDIVKKTIN